MFAPSFIQAKASPSCHVIAGGGCDDSVGYFIEPTIIVTTDPQYATMQEELFGPVLTVHVYPHADYAQTLQLCDETSPYALTGALFARDRYALEAGANRLRNAAGNFYLNDKCTGSMVGQQVCKWLPNTCRSVASSSIFTFIPLETYFCVGHVFVLLPVFLSHIVFSGNVSCWPSVLNHSRLAARADRARMTRAARC